MTNTKPITATIDLEDVNTEQNTEVKVGFIVRSTQQTPTARVIKRRTHPRTKPSKNNTYRNFLGY